MYITEFCPNCNKINFVYLSDSVDITTLDTDGCRCWHCQHEWLFNLEYHQIINDELSEQKILENFSVNIVDGVQQYDQT